MGCSVQCSVYVVQCLLQLLIVKITNVRDYRNPIPVIQSF